MRFPLPERRVKRGRRVTRAPYLGCNIVQMVGRLGIDKLVGGHGFRVVTRGGQLASLNLFTTQQAAVEHAAKQQNIQLEEHHGK